MKNAIFYSLYRLNPKEKKSRMGSRVGAFIRVNDGVSDLVSWPERGEKSLEALLSELRDGIPLNSLSWPLKQSVLLAQAESDAIRSGANLVNQLSQLYTKGLETLKSYVFCGNVNDYLENKASFVACREVKIKISNAIELGLFLENSHAYPSHQRFILDFNLNLKQQEIFESFAKHSLSPLVSRILYIEDPLELKSDADLQKWEALSQAIKVPLANDYASTKYKVLDESRIDQGQAPFLYSVTKPWQESPMPIVESAANSMRRVVLTNQMGHHFHSILTLKLMAPCVAEHSLLFDSMGVSSGEMWEDPWGFSEYFRVSQDGTLVFGNQPGAGWGMEEIFKKIEWRSIDRL